MSERFQRESNGGGGRDRTADPRLMSPLLYQLSYTATPRGCTKACALTSSAVGFRASRPRAEMPRDDAVTSHT